MKYLKKNQGKMKNTENFIITYTKSIWIFMFTKKRRQAKSAVCDINLEHTYVMYM